MNLIQHMYVNNRATKQAAAIAAMVCGGDANDKVAESKVKEK